MQANEINGYTKIVRLQVLSEFLIGLSPMVVSVVFVVESVLKHGFLRARQLFLPSYATMLHTINASGTGTASCCTARVSLVAVRDLIKQ
jgi:hypothetical protein